MDLKDIISRIDVWEEWKNSYKKFVPLFIEEAIHKKEWKDWNGDVFYEYFERSKNQCISSLQQGYFSNTEKERIKENWGNIASLLKLIAESQQIPLFDVYEQIRNEIFKYTDNNKEAAVNRLIAGLQPNLLTTVVSYKHLMDLKSLLKSKCELDLPDFQYTNWFKDSNLILKTFKAVLHGYSSFDIITYPWQTLNFLQETNINSLSMHIEKEKTLNLLRYKKQIILQGPPGTGKTKLGKELAIGLVMHETITISEIKNFLSIGLNIKSATGHTNYTIKVIGDTNVTVGLRGSTNEYKPSYTEIIKAFNIKMWNGKQVNGNDPYAAAIAKYLYNNITSTQIKIIQFHPSYSYEDFVRGIVSKPNEDGEGIVYEAENKLLAEFAKIAYDNYTENKENSEIHLDRAWLDSMFDEFITAIEGSLVDNNHKIPLTGKLSITNIKKDAFRISSDGWKGEDLKFSQIKKLFEYDIQKKSQLNRYPDIDKTVYHRTSYYFPIVEKFKDFLVNHPQPDSKPKSTPKNYVLIIDEINRANLSSVLGELIYALEYRGENVESMYEVDGRNTLVLPDNLYIIGTMNTADRSVGHIDYAIRRRFAFVDVMPMDLTGELGDHFHKGLFDKVAALFMTNLSPEFEKKDVQLGHSYFIDKADEGGPMTVRLQYEIKPLLMEYVKDGILIGESIKNEIENLQA